LIAVIVRASGRSSKLEALEIEGGGLLLTDSREYRIARFARAMTSI
jgi:hypothetical protein